jgi:hypothetical protein
MKTIADERSDALVDTYRALIAINRVSTSPSPAPIIPQSTRCIPGKRLRNWHRKSGADWASLRSFARMLVRTADTASDRDRQVVARAWLAGKGMRP